MGIAVLQRDNRTRGYIALCDLQLPVTAERGVAGQIVGSGHIRASDTGECLNCQATRFAAPEVAPVNENVAVFAERGAKGNC